jgi:hypothetical protein
MANEIRLTEEQARSLMWSAEEKITELNTAIRNTARDLPKFRSSSYYRELVSERDSAKDDFNFYKEKLHNMLHRGNRVRLKGNPDWYGEIKDKWLGMNQWIYEVELEHKQEARIQTYAHDELEKVYALRPAVAVSAPIQEWLKK